MLYVNLAMLCHDCQNVCISVLMNVSYRYLIICLKYFLPLVIKDSHIKLFTAKIPNLKGPNEVRQQWQFTWLEVRVLAAGWEKVKEVEWRRLLSAARTACSGVWASDRRPNDNLQHVGWHLCHTNIKYSKYYLWSLLQWNHFYSLDIKFCVCKCI